MNKFEYSSKLFDIKDIIQSMNTDIFLRAEVGKESLTKYKSTLERFNNTLDPILNNLLSISIKTVEDIYQFYVDLTAFYKETNQLDNLKFINNKSQLIDDIEYFENRFNTIYERISGILNTSIQNENIEEYIKNINVVRDGFEQQSEEIAKKLEAINSKSDEVVTKLNEVETIKNSVQSQLNDFREKYTPENVNLELRNQQKIYSEESKQNQIEAHRWIAAIIAALIILISLIFYFINCFDHDLQHLCVCIFKNFNTVCPTCGQQVLWFYLIKHTLLKALVLSINIYILKFFIKNYNACKHNQTVNKQRQNSFGAALHFYNTIVSDKKDEILVMAANSIFAHQKTGYIEKGSEPNNPAMVDKIVEVAKIAKDIKD